MLAIRERPEGQGRGQYGITFTFGIAMRADDFGTLREVNRTLGDVGRFSMHSERGHILGPNGKKYPNRPMVQLRVTRREGIKAVIAHFRRWRLRSKKRRDFEIWARAFEEYTRATWPRGTLMPRELLAKMRRYRDELREVRKFSGHGAILEGGQGHGGRRRQRAGPAGSKGRAG